MHRRNLLKTLICAPAIIRSGVLMPVVPLVAHVGIDSARGPSLSSLYTVKVGQGGRVQGFGLQEARNSQARLILDSIGAHTQNWLDIYAKPVGATDWPPHLAEALRRQPGSLWAAGVRA